MAEYSCDFHPPTKKNIYIIAGTIFLDKVLNVSEKRGNYHPRRPSHRYPSDLFEIYRVIIFFFMGSQEISN